MIKVPAHKNCQVRTLRCARVDVNSRVESEVSLDMQNVSKQTQVKHLSPSSKNCCQFVICIVSSR